MTTTDDTDTRAHEQANPDAHSAPGPSEESLLERVDGLENRLVAQEHRPLAILNDIRAAKAGSDRWWSAVTAMFVRVFLANPVVVAGTGAVAIIGVALAYQANQTLNEQNLLIAAQNQFFQDQIRQQAVQDFRARRTQLLATLFDTRPCWEGEIPPSDEMLCMTSSIQARAAAVESLIQLENSVRSSPSHWPGVEVRDRTSLHGIHLEGANLRDADFRGTSLRDAWLQNADLTMANLTGVDLGGTNLENASLSAANLSEANLDRVNLDRAHMVEANLTNAKLHHASLRGTKLTKAQLVGAELMGADLTSANLAGADLRQAWLLDTNLAGASLRDSCLHGAIALTTPQLETAKSVPDDAWAHVTWW